MKNNKIIISGGTGFIGQGLLKYFGKDNEVIILSRQKKNHESNLYNSHIHSKSEGYRVTYLQWNGKTVEDHWLKHIDGADLVINLAGKSVNCRYNKIQKQKIFDSRTHATRTIGEAISNSANPPKLWINAASTTIYQHTSDFPNDEFTGRISDLKKDNMPYNILDDFRFKGKKFIAKLFHGKNSVAYKELDLDFSVQVCKLWEKTFFEQTAKSTRKIALRMAITLGEDGVLTPFLNLCKFGLGGKHGSGKQMFSWVHIEDVARMIEWLYENPTAEGIYNCVAPEPVTNNTLLKTLRKITGNKFGLPAPAFLLELGSFLIGTETELLLKSRWVSPARAIKEGYSFKYPHLEDSLKSIINPLPRRKYHLF